MTTRGGAIKTSETIALARKLLRHDYVISCLSTKEDAEVALDAMIRPPELENSVFESPATAPRGDRSALLHKVQLSCTRQKIVASLLKHLGSSAAMDLLDQISINDKLDAHRLLIVEKAFWQTVQLTLDQLGIPLLQSLQHRSGWCKFLGEMVRQCQEPVRPSQKPALTMAEEAALKAEALRLEAEKKLDLALNNSDVAVKPKLQKSLRSPTQTRSRPPFVVDVPVRSTPIPPISRTQPPAQEKKPAFVVETPQTQLLSIKNERDHFQMLYEDTLAQLQQLTQLPDLCVTKTSAQKHVWPDSWRQRIDASQRLLMQQQMDVWRKRATNEEQRNSEIFEGLCRLASMTKDEKMLVLIEQLSDKVQQPPPDVPEDLVLSKVWNSPGDENSKLVQDAIRSRLKLDESYLLELEESLILLHARLRRLYWQRDKVSSEESEVTLALVAACSAHLTRLRAWTSTWPLHSLSKKEDKLSSNAFIDPSLETWFQSLTPNSVLSNDDLQRLSRYKQFIDNEAQAITKARSLTDKQRLKLRENILTAFYNVLHLIPEEQTVLLEKCSTLRATLESLLST